MNGVTPDYRAYLLRLWHTRDDGGCWRASLEDAGTRELQVFANVSDLVYYLATITRSVNVLDRDRPDEPEGGHL